MKRSWTPKRQLLGYYGLIAAAHLLGWGTLLWLSARYPSLIALGALAYGFGLRHAFDADHIAVIDNVTRKLLATDGNPIGTGFFFSLGHSSVVFVAATLIGLSAEHLFSGLSIHSSRWSIIGGAIGTGVSGICLVVIGVVNLVVLLDILRRSRPRGSAEAASRARRNRGASGICAGEVAEPTIGGPLYRLFGRVTRRVGRSHHMFLVGMLFGLGFDTASEIGLLAVSAGASTQGFSIYAVLTLPILFAAGMSLMDTSEGALMAKAYVWSTGNRRRRLVYNLTMTGISVAAALAIGTGELLRFLVDAPAGLGRLRYLLDHVDSWMVGVACVSIFAILWLGFRMLSRRGSRREEAVRLAD